MDVKSVEDLEVFKLAHELVLKVCAVTRTFPREETFGLAAQLRRAATSVVANLVEGAGRLNRASPQRTRNEHEHEHDSRSPGPAGRGAGAFAAAPPRMAARA
jgi:hypothetical protein